MDRYIGLLTAREIKVFWRIASHIISVRGYMYVNSRLVAWTTYFLLTFLQPKTRNEVMSHNIGKLRGVPERHLQTTESDDVMKIALMIRKYG